MRMRSMTGYGRGTCEVAGRRLVVELRSRQPSLPRAQAAAAVGRRRASRRTSTQRVRAQLERGVVTVSVRDEGGGDGAGGARRRRRWRAPTHTALERAARARSALDEPVSLGWWRRSRACSPSARRAATREALWRALEPGLERGARRAGRVARARGRGAARRSARARSPRSRRCVDELRELTARRARAATASGCASGSSARSSRGEVDPQRLAQEVAILADKRRRHRGAHPPGRAPRPSCARLARRASGRRAAARLSRRRS